MKRIAVLSALLLAVVALSCGEIPTVAGPGASSTPAARTAVPATPAWPAEAQPVVDLAIADLTQQTGVKDVEVVSVEVVEWRNGCLDCAKKGEMCTEALVPGYRVVLRAAGQQYEYRTDKGSTVRLCQAETGTGDWGAAQPFVDKAVADLMSRLGIPATAITVVTVEEKMWSDSSMGCPKPGQAYLTVIVPGYQILLEAGAKQYDYHTDKKEAVFLCENATQ